MKRYLLIALIATAISAWSLATIGCGSSCDDCKERCADDGFDGAICAPNSSSSSNCTCFDEGDDDGS